jgi:hypothetical protein
MMRIAGVLTGVLIVLSATPAAGQQAPACRQPLAKVSVPERSYASVGVPEFDGRVYLYVPQIEAASRGTFAAFQLWIVEGVYGRPFVEPRGRMNDATFDRLRKSRNVRATPMKVSRTRETLRVTMARRPFVLEVGVTLGSTDTVTASVCRAK